MVGSKGEGHKTSGHAELKIMAETIPDIMAKLNTCG